MSNEVVIDPDWLEELKQAIRTNERNLDKVRHGTEWSPEEERFLATYYGRFMADIGRVKAKHLAWVLGRTLGATLKKAQSLECEGKIAKYQMTED